MESVEDVVASATIEDHPGPRSDPRTLDQTERLEAILKNVSDSRDAVRKNILRSAQQQLQATGIRSIPISHATVNASQARLIALLNEDDDPDSADPAIKPSLAPLIWPVPTSHSHQPAPDLNGAMQAMDIESGEVSEAMSIDSNSDSGIADVHSSADDALLTGTELATRTLLALEMHDAHARQSMAFYEEALPRRGGAVVPQTAPAGGTTATGFDFGVQSPVVGRSGEERRASVAAAGGEGRQSAGVYDSARDPRLAGFNGGSASQMIPEPVEERSVSGAGGPPSGTYDRTRDPRLSRR